MILVTGATGNVGRGLVELLLAEGAQVRAVTRDPDTARLPEKAGVVKGNPSAPETLADALDGVTAVFVNPVAMGDGTGKFLALARERGVRRVVMLSSGAVQDGAAQQADALAAWHKEVENSVTASGLQWTILRPGEFAANVIDHWGAQIRATGIVRGAYGESTTNVIHERDIAAVAVRALLTADHVGATYVLTGPQSLTRREMVATVADVLGRPVRFEEVTPQQALQHLTGQGLPPSIAETVLALQAEAVHRPAFVTSTVEQVLGRPALTFAEWVADHAADLS